ncbi:MAG: phosphoribosyltransferase [Planctomycetota bacterium]|nr:MAG: phosphoribosyltransferase [Planctomycetota bacterium]
MVRLPFRDRTEAGRVLAEAMASYAGRPDLLVLGLPRGGVVVAYEVARALGAPLDVLIVRKLGRPGQEELAMGAIASGGIRVMNPQVAAWVPPSEIEAVIEREAQELRRRELAYRGDRPPPELAGRSLVLVDDGLATGATMRAAVQAVRQRAPAEVVVAVPVAPPDTVALLATEADAVVCPATPEPFFGIGQWYEDFSQTTDAEVRELLARARSGSD